MRLLIYLFFIFLIPISVNAQNIKLIDKATNSPIKEVAVYSKSSNFSTLSNDLGIVILDNCDSNEILVFDHIGYETISFRKKNLSDKLSLIAKVYSLPVVDFSEIKNEIILTNGVFIQEKEIASHKPYTYILTFLYRL